MAKASGEIDDFIPDTHRGTYRYGPRVWGKLRYRHSGLTLTIYPSKPYYKNPMHMGTIKQFVDGLTFLLYREGFFTWEFEGGIDSKSCLFGWITDDKEDGTDSDSDSSDATATTTRIAVKLFLYQRSSTPRGWVGM